MLAQGGHAAETWTGAQRAVRTIDTITSGWTTLGVFIHALSVPLDKRYLAMRFADLDYRTHRSLDRTTLTRWSAVIAGVELSLPTFPGYKERVAAWLEAMHTPEMVVDELRSSIAGREVRVQV